MKKVLFPVDFSQAAQHAFAHALHFAHRMKARLYLLHAFEIPVMDSALFPENYMSLYSSMELSHFEGFQDVIQQLHQTAQQMGIPDDDWVHMLRPGSVVSTIVQVCEEEQIDAVVMGTHGADHWLDAWWGSTTWGAVQAIKVPLLCIPQTAAFAPITTVGFSTLFQRKDVEGLLKVLDLAHQWQIQVKAVFVETPQSITHADTWEFWTRHFSDRPVQFYKVQAADIQLGLQQFVQDQQVDVLAMTTHKHDIWHEWLGHSQAKQWALHAQVPALFYH